MIIGLDGSRAFLQQRTGIEEYSYQVIKNLVNELDKHEVVLYIKKNQKIDFSLPENWKVKIIRWPYFWTQIGLSLELLFHPVDVLFISAHIVPIIHPACDASFFSWALFIQKSLKSFGISTYYNQHSDAGGPKKTFVTIHGLEYEFVPEAYLWWEKIYMRWAIKKSCQRAQKIIAVSENTKKDLMKLYKVPEEKIRVIHEGYEINPPRPCLPAFGGGEDVRRTGEGSGEKHLLFIGRLEERKNIIGIIKTFEILKEKYKIPHKLVLSGKIGFNYKKIQSYLSNSFCKSEIILTGFVSEEEKQRLLKNADVFLFPTFYEGFGLPILEAQNAGVPVVASNNSSIPEVVKIPLLPLERSLPAGRQGARRADEGILQDAPLPNPLPEGEGARDFSALLVDPKNPAAIAEATIKIIQDEKFKKDLIQKGLENVKRFSWKKCASSIAELIKN